MLKYWLVLSLAVALALARPEVYKEKEDFKYSRSSTDEGSKAGFYEAQRGNVGGNYERAHNMDTVAQGQMSDAIDQVGSQVREVADAKHGNVYGAAYTSGIYGQRSIDRSNIRGRNFEDNAHEGSSHYRQGYSENLLDSANSNTGSRVGQGYGSSQASGFQSSASHSSSNYNHEYAAAAAASDHSQYRRVPVKISLRPSDEVNMGLNAGIAEHMYSQNLQDGRLQSQNSLVHTNAKPSSGSNYEKHHETSYKYEKNWEKHSEVTPVPLSIPYSNVEFVNNNEQSQNYRSSNHEARENRHSVDAHSNYGSLSNAGVNERGYESGYRSGYQRVAEPINNRYVVLSPTPEFVATESKTAAQSASSHHDSEYNAGSRLESHNAYRGQSSASGNLRTNEDNLFAASGHNHDALLAVNGNADKTINAEPKKYHSSYAYHKSWERQGDPYVIVPPSDVGTVQSDKLQSYNHGYAKNSHYSNAEKQDDCEEEQRRYRRSPEANILLPPQVEMKNKQTDNFDNHSGFVGSQTIQDDQVNENIKQEVEKISQRKEDSSTQAEDSGHQSFEFTQQTEDLAQENEGEFGLVYEDYNIGKLPEQLTENM